MNINALSTQRFIHISFLLIFLVQICNLSAYTQEYDDDHDVLDVGVRLTAGKQDSLIADLIANERDILNAGHIDGIGVYHFHIRRERNHRSKRAMDDIVEDLKRDERIESVIIAERLERQKRDLIDDLRMINFHQRSQEKSKSRLPKTCNQMDTSKLRMSFNDELYCFEWYLENVGQLNITPNHDINVVAAWSAGYTGKGVVISIVDDGLDHAHPDLSACYRADLSFDLNDLNDTEHDPSPRMDDSSNSHGTRCAGAAASKANNGICGVGTAYGACLSGIRLLDGRITTLLEARSITLFAVDIDIKSASWGPTDDGTKMEAPGALANAAIEYAVTHGRHGKGTIFVWASGNGGADGDDCGADGYVSHQDVISIGAVNDKGKTTYFHEHCPSTMAVVYAGGKHELSTGEKTMPIGIVATDPGGGCTTQFFGTSAAAPVAAGAIALVLEANPELTYRDVMHIIARTARIPNLEEAEDWIINGAGFHVSDKFGFGVLDVGQMVALAQNWTNVQPRYQLYQEHQGPLPELEIESTVEVTIDVEECFNVTSIEHVVANISYSFHRRGDVKITIISPTGTQSELLSYRDNDASYKGTKYFPFLTVHHWGEYPIGRWTLRLETRLPQTINATIEALLYEGSNELNHFGLRIYGSNDPEKNDVAGEKEQKQQNAFKPSENEIHSIYEREFQLRTSSVIMQKRDYDKLRNERQLLKEKRSEIEQDKSIFGYFRQIFNF